MAEKTPLMQQYHKIKSQHASEVLFFRLGDFYEMFDDDAVEVSRLLNLTLTHRGDSPMCGVPHHASKLYIARLLRLGKKIAICEQITLPKNGKGLAERKVVEVITPGTALEEEYLDQGSHNFLASVCLINKTISWAYIDISTGDFFASSWESRNLVEHLEKELGRIQPKEIVVAKNLFEKQDVQSLFEQYPNMSVSFDDDWHFNLDITVEALKKQFHIVNLHSLGITENSPEVASAGYLLEYVSRNSILRDSDKTLKQVTSLSVYSDLDFVMIDDSSRRNLELTSNLRDNTMQYSLFETVEHTKTAMGKRLLSSFFMYPLKDLVEIKNREQHISLFVNHTDLLDSIRTELSKILDIERLSSRIAMGRAHAKDIQALRMSLERWLEMRRILSDYVGQFGNAYYAGETETAIKICDYINKSILDDPSTSLTEGRIIKTGWSEELDNYRNIKNNFKEYLDTYLEKEKNDTGIQNMKVKYNNNMGYFLEVSKGKIASVPPHFVLRRALVNADRYTTDKLRELEAQLTDADDKIIELEKRLFEEVREKIGSHIKYFLAIAKEIAYIDTSVSFAWTALLYNWVCPELDDSTSLEIIDGRHPVVESHLPSGEFVPNNTSLAKATFVLLTGPNMAGKSTYLRQNALIVFLSQIGSFVPAKSAHIGIVDRIFCRVGASDNLARGESTFLVEMAETALILRSATEKSLVIMDEVGRGTSTEDGLSLAWAISEYLLNTICSRTFFATHYHELTRISHKNLQLLQMQVKELDGNVVFLKKICKGAAESSYGLHVAKMAGVPECVVNRAEEILQIIQQKTPYTQEAVNLETAKISNNQSIKKVDVHSHKSVPGLFSEEELVLEEILSTEVDEITPLQALQKIAHLKKQLLGK
ncbi:MAG: DNA mismatch repair protein MutS [Treponema sp. CETP13]|nr:MAG: DNA mismatch repair protein MutS [Treponema sp. CETP13]